MDVRLLGSYRSGTGLGAAIVAKNEAEAEAAKGVGPTGPNEIIVYPDKIKAAKTALAQANEAKDIEQIKAQTIELAKWKRALKSWRAANRTQLLLDLLSEESVSAGEGRVITFHRFQIVLWTLILGVVFISEVLTKLAMPVFDTTLLTLMGISSGTYLGFKVAK